MTFVGVDLQEIDRNRSVRRMQAVADCLFSPAESERLRASNDFAQTFYGVFSAKEALYKALFPLSTSGLAPIRSLRDLSLQYERGRARFEGVAPLRAALDRLGYFIDVTISHSAGYAMAVATVSRCSEAQVIAFPARPDV